MNEEIKFEIDTIKVTPKTRKTKKRFKGWKEVPQELVAMHDPLVENVLGRLMVREIFVEKYGNDKPMLEYIDYLVKQAEEYEKALIEISNCQSTESRKMVDIAELALRGFVNET